MRGWLTLAVCCGFVGTALAEEPAVRVFCPAVSFDDHDERGVNGPDGPHPVVLMVVGKTVPKGDKAEFKKRRSGPATRDAEVVEVEIERVLFGSPPGKRISIPLRYGRFPANAHTASHVYGFVAGGGRGDKIGYDGDDYYLYDRTYPIEKLAKAEALARARLDLLVLSQLAIVVGQPSAEATKLAMEGDDPFAPGPTRGAQVTIERVLHGSLQAGARITVGPDQRPIPLTGEGPFIYFLEATRKSDNGQLVYRVETRWSLDALDTVKAALARRSDYPIKEREEDGEKIRQQEILFTGPHSAALELLQEDRNPLEILGARRIISDGEAAIPDVVKLIEKHLWQPRIEGVADFQWQENLIKILAVLEDHRTDGQIARLIDEVLTKAERGASFPLKVVEREENDGLPRRRLRYGQDYDTTNNHSLGWLLLTLEEQDAARLYGERLIKLRDLAAYGWKDEAQVALDALHIEDHLALAKVEPKSKELPTKKWAAGFRGDGSFDHFAFSRDGKLLAAASYEAVRVWNTADWSIAAEFEQSASVDRLEFAPDGQSLLFCGGGQLAVFQRLDWRTGKSLQKYSGLESAGSFDLSDDGRWIVASEGYRGSLLVFDAQSGKLVSKQPQEDWYRLQWRPGAKQFLGSWKDRWTIGDVEKKDRQVLKFAARDVAWAQDGLWSLEDDGKGEVKPVPADPFGQPPNAAPPRFTPPPFNPAGVKPPSEVLPPLPAPGSDPWGGPGVGRPSILRLRQVDDKFSITLERKISFTATELLVSDDRQTVVVLSDAQAEVFAAPTWKSVAAWKIPVNANEKDPYGNRAAHVLSPDGKWLAIARERNYPKLVDVRTGKIVPLGAGHSNEIISLNFADNITIRTRDLNDEVIRWKAATGEKLPAQPADLTALKADDDERQRRRHETFTAEDGRVWTIVGQGGGAYERYTSYAVSAYPQGYKPAGDPFSDEPEGKRQKRVEPELLDEIEVRWNQRGPNGLVPGGQYLHIGTRIFALADLKLISGANVYGEIDQLEFTPDGKRYLLLTSVRESRPAPLGLGAFREEVSQRIRIHDTTSGQTLFSIPTGGVKLLALAPDQKRLATVNERQEVQVWNLSK